MKTALSFALPVLTLCASLSAADGVPATWPPTDYLVESLVAAVPELLDSYHPDTGKFGTEPWVYQDQMAIYPLAAAWSLDDPRNPHFHDEKLLGVIARGGEVWYEQQNEDGTWRLLRKNGDDWGTFRSSYVASHWAATYSIVGDALPEASRAIWEKGLKRCLGPVPKMLESAKAHNQPLRHALALYIAGVCFDKQAWRETAQAYMHRLTDAQNPAGYWAEHEGPASAYSMAYPWFLGIYYHFSKDAAVLEALERASTFHLLTRWPDGSLIACIDDRTLYNPAVRLGDVGFSFCPEGRALLYAQLIKNTDGLSRHAPAEYAANMLLFGGQGPVAQLPEQGGANVVAVGDNEALIAHDVPWHAAVSGYTAEISTSRWFQDRHNLIDVFHEDLGLVAGGGNTKLQPYWSTFTVGDPDAVGFTVGNETPDFVPETDLLWVPEEVTLKHKGTVVTATVRIGEVTCTAAVETTDDGRIRLVYSAPQGKNAEAHLPLMRRGGTLRLADGTDIALSEEEMVLRGDRTQPYVDLDGLRIHLPEGAYLRWPVRHYNPYRKDGSSSLSKAKLVVVMPFATADTYTVTLQRVP